MMGGRIGAAGKGYGFGDRVGFFEHPIMSALLVLDTMAAALKAHFRSRSRYSSGMWSRA